MCVADERVVVLRVHIVRASGIRAPTVVAHACAVAIRAGLEVVVIWRREIIRVKNHRRTDLHERTDAEAVVKAGGIQMWRGGHGIEARDDVGVQIAVTIVALQRAAGVGCAFETIVNHACSLCWIAVLVEAKVACVGRAVVNAAVRHIHDETRSDELSLSKTFAREPRKITRPGR